MAQHNETNPHFISQNRPDDGSQHRPWHQSQRRPQSQNQDPQHPHSRPHIQWVPEPQHQDQNPHQHGVVPLVPNSPEDQHSQPHTHWTPGTQRPGQTAQPHDPQMHHPLHKTRRTTPVLIPEPPLRQSRHSQPQEPPLRPSRHSQPQEPPLRPSRHSQPLEPPQRPSRHSHPQEPPQRQSRHSQPQEPPQRQSRHFQPLAEQPHREGRHSNQHRPGQGLWAPASRKTKPLTWFAAVFCVIFWIIIILGGLIVLIVYLIFRPRSPRFDLSSATLNAAYLDMGYLLNADLTLLANFTNPNKKVSVDFSYMTIDLYYGTTLIATQYIEPFSAEKLHSKFETIHMVSSQVRLPIKESLRLQKQMAGNGAIFEVKGVFRTRSRLGSVLRYSYWLYGHCKIVLTAPPSGVLRSSYCKTKR